MAPASVEHRIGSDEDSGTASAGEIRGGFSAAGDSAFGADSAFLIGLTDSQKQRLGEVLDRYLSALEQGAPLSAAALHREHTDLAEPLAWYLKSLAELHEMAAGFGGGIDRGEPCAGTDGAAQGGATGRAAEGDERRLGDFRLGQEIGRGGMGIVYEAQQVSLNRRVALKVLPFAAVLDSRQIARFKNEASAAAQLHHPHIVPVFAVGVERGVHFYAMQFIDGQSLDRAIAELRDVAARRPEKLTREVAPGVGPSAARLAEMRWAEKWSRRQAYFRTIIRLGIEAAEALDAAHRDGIVHRDIKPSNLLLDRDGKLWITDFGLARFQADVTLTRTGDVLGTMRYMSPEQALGRTELVDHRSDVYSLGVTLYELLTLHPAFGAQGPELARQIERQTPTRPRQLQPHLPPDLETVVLKAMAADREQRYATAQKLADDLRRVLEGQPTQARPPTMPERLAKWTWRHQRIAAAAAAIGLLAALGLATSTLLISREQAKTEKNFARAERNFRDAQEAVDHFGAELAQRLNDLPGAEAVRRDLLNDTLRYYHRFIEQAADDPKLRADLAMTYSKIGTLTAEIGLTEEAIAAHQQAAVMFQQLAIAEPQAAEHRRRLALSQNNLALVFGRVGRIADAEQAFVQAIAGQRRLLADAPDNPDSPADLALSLTNLGLLQSETRADAAAARSLDEAIDLYESLATQAMDSAGSTAAADAEQKLALAYNNRSVLFHDQPERQAALYNKALAIQTRAAMARPGEWQAQSDLALTFSNLGAAQSRQGNLAEAAANYRRAIELQQQLLSAAPAQRSFRRDLAVSFNNLGLTQSQLGQPAEAKATFHHALELQTEVAEQNPRELDVQSSLGGIHNNLAIVLEALGDQEQAAEQYRQAVEHQLVAQGNAPSVDRFREFLSKHYVNYGRVLRQLGRTAEAVRIAEARRRLWPNDPQRLLSVAEEFSLASQQAVERAEVERAEEYAELAVDTLRAAVKIGLRLPAEVSARESFAPVKDRKEFQQLFESH